MTTTVLRPDVTNSGGGSFTVTGAASAHAALADSSDGTYIRKSATGTASILLGNGTTTISSAQIVRQVRVRGRVEATETDSKANLYLGTRVGAINYFTSAVAIRGVTAIGEVTGPWYTVAPDGGAWTQEKIDSIRVQFTDYKNAASRAYLYATYVDVDIAAQPTTTVTAPTGTITTTGLPDVSWTFSDTDGEAQSYYRVKIFDAATYGAGGFDPETATALWDSGTVSSIDTTTSVASILDDGTYRAYVKTAKTVNGSAFWSAWAYSGFVIDVTPPPTPTVAVAYASGAVTATVTGGSPTGFTSQTFEVQTSTDGGTTWADVRDGNALSPNGTYIATVADFDAPRGIVLAYRARAVGVSGDDQVASPWSSSATITVANDGLWWLKVVGYPALNISGVRVLNGPQEKQSGQVGVFQPIGREKSVVVEGSLGGADGSYDVMTGTDAEWTALLALVSSQQTILVQDPFGQQKYVRVTDRSWTLLGTPDAPRRQVQISYVEVAA